jgi:RNase P subunit RPR2
MIRNRKLLSEIAIERIHKLISMSKARALSAGTGDALSRRYISIAKDISIITG